MSSKNFPHQLPITSPCNVAWDSMIGNDRVRFCEHCQLSVHNLSLSNRKQVRRLIARSQGRLCVSYQQPDSRRESVPVLHKIGRRTSAIAAGAVSATLGITTAMAATSNVRQATFHGEVASVTRLLDQFSSSAGGTLTGTVFDPNDAVIPGASVTLTNADTQSQQHTTTNDEGRYTFNDLDPGNYHLKIEREGFVTNEVRFVAVQAGGENRVDQHLSVAGVSEMTGVVAIVTPGDPLVKAAMEDDLEAFKAALQAKPNPNARDKESQSTALEQAIRNGNREIVQLLLWAKVDVNAKDNDGQTALMMISEKVISEIVWDLIHAGAKVNLRDNDGDTALISAAEVNNVDALKALLDAGAKVNASNNDGKTALMMAAASGLVNNVRALILAGADVNARDKEGKSALMYALSNNEAAVARLLKAHGAIEFEVPEKP